MAKRRSQAILFFSILAFMFICEPVPGKTDIFTGKAVNELGDLPYVERHEVTFQGESPVKSRTTYLDPDKRIIGYLESEYSDLPQFSDYTFRDLRRGYTDGARVESDRVCMFRKRGPEDQEETRCLDRQANQIIGQGFHHFVSQRLEAIAEGRIFHVLFVLPSRLDQYAFRILKKDMQGNRLSIRFEIDNWLLRLFTPYVEATYELDSGRIVSYQGMTNVADASGSFTNVQIFYDH